MAKINVTQGTAGAYGAGELQLENKVQMTSALVRVTDNANTASPLRLSTTHASSYGTGGISTNVQFGADSLSTNTTGNGNTAIGNSALQLVSTGTGNTGIGYLSLQNNTNSNNTALGYRSLRANTSGSQNTGVAVDALLDNTTGIGNTAVGYATGGGITTGSYNTILGANVTGLSATLSNNIILADGQGNTRINVDSSGNVGIGTSSPATYGFFVVNSDAPSSGVSEVIRNSTDVGGDNTRYAGLDFMIGSDNGTAAIRAFRTNSAVDYSTSLALFTKGSGANPTVPTERVGITHEGYVRLTTNSGGIQFNGDTAAANALNDYEEGTWTPVITANLTAPTGVTYSYRAGNYTKIGNRVIANCGFNISSVGTGGVGNLQISGLPFTTTNYGPYQEPSVKTQGGGWLTASLAYSAYVFAVGNSNLLEFRDGSNVDSPIPYAQLLIGTYLGVVIIYNV